VFFLGFSWTDTALFRVFLDARRLRLARAR